MNFYGHCRLNVINLMNILSYLLMKKAKSNLNKTVGPEITVSKFLLHLFQEIQNFSTLHQNFLGLRYGVS